ncbi:cytochrome P450 CYP12A2-like [Epargyreus clarus]|uniref:cytochrome P450 CYP12A2-like n=1 Tax=Epargyreus clarus TaxID=520877 RepID=UPI003C2FA610
MQTSKLRPVYKLIAVNQNFVRTIAVNNAAVDTNLEPDLKSWKEIPGPSSLPLIGQLRHFLPGGSLHGLTGMDFQEHMYKQYGPIVRLEGIMGSPTLVFLFDAEASAQVLHGENWMPVRPGFMSLDYYRKVYSRNKDDPIDKPTGLITDHNEVWKKFRSTVNPIMLKPKTIKLYSKILDEVALDMVARMKSNRDEKNMIKNKFDVEMNLWALESIGVVALGGRLNCFDPNLPQDSPARQLIQVVHDVFTVAEQLDFRPSMWRYIHTPLFKKAMKLYEHQMKISKYFIGKAMEQLQLKDQKSDDEKGILEKLLEIDEDVAVIMASDMLLAGVDTASNTMTATLYFLATHPEKQAKLREEITSKQERRPYLKACIKESMRIMPVVSGNLRKICKDYNIMGYKIPADIHVIFCHEYLSLMEEHYPRSKEYIPERWTAEKDDPLYHGNAHPFAFNPFGFGVRSCIGRRIAELEIETFLARVIENFQIEWFGPPLKTRATSLNYTIPPYNFILKDVKST